MAKVKISDTKLYEIELIKLEKKGPTLLNVRQFYATKKDSTFRPGRQGLTLSTEEDADGRSEARRVLKAMLKALKNEDGKKPRLIEKKEKE
jgi:hypothetical protein